MWLLTTDSLQLKYFQHVNTRQNPYAILSHTWGDSEVTFQDVQSQDPGVKDKEGYGKLLACCTRARQDGYRYAWIDTCCIDKSSSAELSEAINSMFAWYKSSSVCYAYLSDVHYVGSSPSGYETVKKLGESRWFTRGWTLQELIAPLSITFFSSDWRPLGTKLSLCKTLSEITGVSMDALLWKPLSEFNVGERMSWAAGRRTTRIEDRAYSLLGIFEINMPLLYGEGVNAFFRLQEVIIEMAEDYTIFAWDRPYHTGGPSSLLASSPDAFDIRHLLVTSGKNVNSDDEELKSWGLLYSELYPALESTQTGSPGENKAVRVPPSVASRGIKMQIPFWESDRKGTILLCSIKSPRLTAPRYLALDVSITSAPLGIVVRENRALGVMDRWLDSVAEVYGARRVVYNEMSDFENRYSILLHQLDQDLLMKLWTTNPLHLADRLARDQWCFNCHTFAPKSTKTDTCGHCYAVDLKPLDHGSVVNDEDETFMEHPAWSTEEGKQFIRRLDPQLFELRSAISNLGKNLPDPTLNVLLCCMVAIVYERRVSLPQDTQQSPQFLNFQYKEFWESIGISLNSNRSIGIFAVHMASMGKFLERDYIHGGLHWSVSANTARFLCHVLECCWILSAKEEDKFGVAIARALCIGRFNEKHPAGTEGFRNLWSVLRNVPTTMHGSEDIISQLKAQAPHRPAVQDLAMFVEWLWSVFTLWSTYWASEDLDFVLLALEQVLGYVEHDLTSDIEQSWILVVRLLSSYCMAQLGRHVHVPKYEKHAAWSKVAIAVKTDLQRRFFLTASSISWNVW